MDILDNLIYATHISALEPTDPANPKVPADPRIISDYISKFQDSTVALLPENVGTATDKIFTYPVVEKMKFCSYEDPDVIETTILRHWYDVNNRVHYDSNGRRPASVVPPIGGADRYSSFADSSTYHLILAYFLENTRMLQIFERLIEKYMLDEELGIADNSFAFNWILNSERLFFKSDTMRSANLRSMIRPSADASRRNAYWRMFGMDLAFGDINSESNAQPGYYKAKISNQQFIILFEKYLSEIWMSYSNANNSSGANPADINNVVDLATQLQELLIARRGNVQVTRYANQNLSREEFSSVLMTTWFAFIISDDTPVVQFLNCQSSTIGERLIKIGNKVGIPAHSKCQSLFEMAGAASHILRTIELGRILSDPAIMPDVLRSLIPGVTPVTENMNLMTDLLILINNWEKATGHRIKNPGAGVISGSVKVQQNGQNGISRPAVITSN
jgi:hypothetical protein